MSELRDKIFNVLKDGPVGDALVDGVLHDMATDAATTAEQHFAAGKAACPPPVDYAAVWNQVASRFDALGYCGLATDMRAHTFDSARFLRNAYEVEFKKSSPGAATGEIEGYKAQIAELEKSLAASQETLAFATEKLDAAKEDRSVLRADLAVAWRERGELRKERDAALAARPAIPEGAVVVTRDGLIKAWCAAARIVIRERTGATAALGHLMESFNETGPSSLLAALRAARKETEH